MKIIPFVCAFLFSTIVKAESWDQKNNPFRMNKNFISIFSSLPTSGKLADKRKGWPSNHWANYLGGVAHRWSSSNPQNFTYTKHSLESLQKLEQFELEELSPAEKFDIYRGDFNYTVTNKILEDNSPDENRWHGICHGVAIASLNLEEPDTVDVISKDGIQLTFYSSDVSGLLSYYFAKIGDSPGVLIGSRCYRNENGELTKSCHDINAGSFHILMTNLLGINGTGFIADTDRFREVWNHVAVSYKTFGRWEEVPSESSALGTKYRVRIESSVKYAGAIAPKFYPVINTPDATYFEPTYEYYLDIDSEGKIIGGEWVSDRRPDFIWTQEKAEFKDIWNSLSEIYFPVP